MKKFILFATLALCLAVVEGHAAQYGFVNFKDVLEKSKLGLQEQGSFNSLKEQMEKFVEPASQWNPNLKKHIKVTVTTSSQKAGAQQAEIIQFTANFKTEDFDLK